MSVAQAIQEKFDQELWALYGANPPKTFAVAVSGGSDSLALLHMAKDWADRHDVTVQAVTVDHGLRPEAADEAAYVAQLARSLGVKHDILHWDKRPVHNMQAEARTARYDLIDQWRGSITDVLLGHTATDQQETFLLALKRGSGLDGLTAMPQFRTYRQMRLIRPVLSFARDDLRAYLTARSIDWVEDPSNINSDYDRIKLRQAEPDLSVLGLTHDKFRLATLHLQRARDALDFYVREAADRVASEKYGSVVLTPEPTFELPEEVQFRLITYAIQYVTSAPYKPRFSALSEALEALKAGRGFSLSGALLFWYRGAIWITREYQAIKDVECDPGQIWDSRWCLTDPYGRVRALGPQGCAQVPKEAKENLPHKVAMSLPALWDKDQRCICPILSENSQDAAILVTSFKESLP